MNEMDKLKELTKKLPFLSPNEEINARVLVVENDKRVRKLLSYSLEYIGVKCSGVENGKEAMDNLSKNKYDVLLGHIILSEDVGIGVLRKFQEQNPKAMMVIVSGQDNHLKEYGKYLSILALPFGFYDLIKSLDDNAKDEVV